MSCCRNRQFFQRCRLCATCIAERHTADSTTPVFRVSGFGTGGRFGRHILRFMPCRSDRAGLLLSTGAAAALFARLGAGGGFRLLPFAKAVAQRFAFGLSADGAGLWLGTGRRCPIVPCCRNRLFLQRCRLRAPLIEEQHTADSTAPVFRVAGFGTGRSLGICFFQSMLMNTFKFSKQRYIIFRHGKGELHCVRVLQFNTAGDPFYKGHLVGDLCTYGYLAAGFVLSAASTSLYCNRIKRLALYFYAAFCFDSGEALHPYRNHGNARRIGNHSACCVYRSNGTVVRTPF